MSVEIAGLEVGERIGAGPGARVHRARRLDSGRDCVLKVVPVESSTAAQRRRFELEVQTLAALPRHPNLVEVDDHGESADGSPYVVTEYLPGGSLAQRLPVPADRARELAAGLAAGLTAAHEAGVAHGAVSPEQVLFAADDRPVLIGFGVADTAPDGGSVPADIYRYGATLFAALTGAGLATAAWTGRANGAAPSVHPAGAGTAPHMPLDQVAGHLRHQGIPPDLARVIGRSLTPPADGGYVRMRQAQEDLDTVGGAEGAAHDAIGIVTSRPEDAIAAQSRRRWVVPAMAGAGLILLLALVLGLTGAFGSGRPTAQPTVVDESTGPATLPPPATLVVSTLPGSPTPTTSARPSPTRTHRPTRSPTPTTAAPAPSTTVAPPPSTSSRPRPTRTRTTPTPTPTTTSPSSSASSSTMPPPPPATLSGTQVCALKGTTGTALDVTSQCPGWRQDWAPAATSDYHVCWESAGDSATDPSAVITDNGTCDGSSWTVGTDRDATVTYSYRLRMYRLDPATGQYVAGDASAQVDTVRVTFSTPIR